MSDDAHVTIREVGLRDGLQLVPDFLSTAQKTEWIAATVAAGISEIEITSLVPPALLPQFADAAEVIGFSATCRGLRASVLVPNLKGAERAIAAGARELNVVISVSESHNRANVRRSVAESVVELGRIVALRDSLPADDAPVVAVGLATAFGCSIEGPITESRVIELAEIVLAMNVDGLLIADTVGYGNPAAVRRILPPVLAGARTRPVTVHFHDTRGLGLANALAAWDVGVRRFDASLGGLGGCPYAPGATGNIVTEDTVFMFAEMGVSTEIDLDALLALRRKIETWLPDATFQGNLVRAGLPRRNPKQGV